MPGAWDRRGSGKADQARGTICGLTILRSQQLLLAAAGCRFVSSPAPTYPAQATGSQQQRFGRRSGHKGPAAGGRAGGAAAGAAAALHRRENAANNQQSQRGSGGRRQPRQQAYDALLLQSFDAALAAAGDTRSSWLSGQQELGAARELAGEEQEVSSAPTAQLRSPAAGGTTPLAPPPATAGSPGSPGTGLLLPHLRSAGAEGTSWLMSTSPTHSSDWQSSPSLAISRSLSLSLGSPALTTTGSTPVALLPPGSPITLQPLPPGRLVSPAARAAAAGAAGSDATWWSPGAARVQQQQQQHEQLAQQQQQHQEEEGPPEQQQQVAEASPSPPSGGDLSPLATAALAASHAAAASRDAGGASPEGEPSAVAPGSSGQRRCRSPFLARDCSGVDVWTPDRYARWTGEQLGADGQECGGRLHSGGGGDTPPPPAGGAGFRWRDYVDAVEAGQMGVSWGRAGAGGGGGGGDGCGSRGLRGALKSMLSWVAGRLGPSHPIELTPSELDSYGSAHSSPAGTPCSGSPANGEGSRSRYYTPASGGPSCGSRPLQATAAGSGGSRGRSAGALHWRPAEAAEEPTAAAGAAASAGAAPWGGARALHYSSSEGGSSAGSCSSSPLDKAQAERSAGSPQKSAAGAAAQH
ncbi:hypothetical protein ABPG75_003312 [Micractinium tetrahymenae]